MSFVNKYLQMVGRSVRPNNGKDGFIIINNSGNINKLDTTKMKFNGFQLKRKYDLKRRKSGIQAMNNMGGK